mmetsp:Transcript_145505/g.253906  ORF Transcript_145505/g.253906 Transcript_145505/m.253906 type:complete len:290 (+) Transcript_145505:103-972(+)
MLACRARDSLSLRLAAAFLPTFIASIWTVSAESNEHDEGAVCTSEARSFAEMHSVTPDMALLQKKAVPSQAPALLEESAATATALPKYKHVPLSEQGYSFLSRLKDDREMQGFVRRVIDDLGLEIVDEGGLMGMVPYYSGKKAKQSFAALEAELAKESKKRKAWALPKGTKGSQKRYIELHSIKEYEPEEEEQGDEANNQEVRGILNMREVEGDELADEEDDEELEDEMANEEDQGEENEDTEFVLEDDEEDEDEEEEHPGNPVAVEEKGRPPKARLPLRLARRSVRRK